MLNVLHPPDDVAYEQLVPIGRISFLPDTACLSQAILSSEWSSQVHALAALPSPGSVRPWGSWKPASQPSVTLDLPADEVPVMLPSSSLLGMKERSSDEDFYPKDPYTEGKAL